MVARTGDLWNAGDNPQTRLAARSLLDTLEARRRQVFGQELQQICDLTRSSWLNALHADIAAHCEQAHGVLTDPERQQALHLALLAAKRRPGTALAPLALELMAEPARSAGSQAGQAAPASPEEIAQKIIGRSAPPAGPAVGPQTLPFATRGYLREGGLLAFTWLGRGSEKMRQLAIEARAGLPAQDQDQDLAATQTLALFDPAARRSSSERAWLVLSIMSRDEPPAPEIARWVHTAGERDYWERHTRQGLSVETVDALWCLRMRALEALVALAAPGLPATPQGTDKVHRLSISAVTETGEWRRTARTLVALGFGSAQVRLWLAELARGEKLSANAEAVRYLELALGASFAFWATAGLLAGSAGQNSVNGARARDSPAR